MRLPRVRFTVRMLMVMVAIVALSAFLYETRWRNHGGPLDRNSGRFLVFVKKFKGSSAKSQADALAFELRHQYQLPSYVMVSSEIKRLNLSAKRRKVSQRPAAEEVAAQMTLSAKRRKVSHGPTAEEVAVLIGDCETSAESEAILKQVRRINSNKVTSLVDRLRRGPFRTNNPYLSATATAK